MRPSVGLFQSAVETTSNVLKNADYFNRLPIQLQNFFTRYPPIPFKQYSEKSTSTDAPDANPFLPNRHPVTQKTHNPKFSLRRQSVLWKLAYQYGVQDCLPTLQGGKKFYQEKYDSNEFMKGTLRPKGHRYERNIAERKAKIADALEKSDELIVKVKGNKYKRLLERRSKEGKSWI